MLETTRAPAPLLAEVAAGEAADRPVPVPPAAVLAVVLGAVVMEGLG